MIIVWNFELYMLPITLLIVFAKNLMVVQVVGNLMKEKEDDVSAFHLSWNINLCWLLPSFFNPRKFSLVLLLLQWLKKRW